MSNIESIFIFLFALSTLSSCICYFLYKSLKSKADLISKSENTATVTLISSKVAETKVEILLDLLNRKFSIEDKHLKGNISTVLEDAAWLAEAEKVVQDIRKTEEYWKESRS